MQFKESGTYQQVADVIRFIHENAEQHPSLAELALQMDLSEQHFQRLFSRWVGVSPKRFLQFITKERAKKALQKNRSILETSLDVGLSGPGRLHDLMIQCEAMTPGEIKLKGEGLTILFGSASTPFGEALIGWTERGICYLAFHCQEMETYLQQLQKEWPKAEFLEASLEAAQLLGSIFSKPNLEKPLYLLLKGTNFQIKVWEALLKVGDGEVISYSQLADLAGSPKASRAVGSAMAANKIGFLIPCHRVIRESGELGHYRWGIERKTAMQAWEACRQGD